MYKFLLILSLLLSFALSWPQQEGKPRPPASLPLPPADLLRDLPLAVPRKCLTPPRAEQPAILESQSFSNGRVEYKGIEFFFNSQLASSVVAKTKSAKPLECDTDKPDFNNYPEHAAFRLTGAYATKYDEEGWEPEIRIYSIDAYKQAFAAQDTKDKENLVHEWLHDLQSALKTKPRYFKDDAPFAHFIDGHQEFQAKIRYLDFKNGRGIAYVTEYGYDLYTFITNETPLYVFQGITNDGLYLVSAIFPIKIPFLPENFDAVDRSDLPFNPDKHSDDQRTRNRVRTYLNRITRQSEQLPDEQYLPNLKLFDQLIRSLNVRPHS